MKDLTPKDKAKELIEKYLKLDIEIGGQHDGYLTMKIHNAKQCAIIAVDEILIALYEYDNRTEQYLKEQGIEYQSYELQNMDADFRYWQEVKQELNKES